MSRKGVSMNIAYINAKLLNTNHNAFIVSDGKFKLVGSKHLILNQTVDKVVDLKDKHVLPGFNDSHMHLLGIGKSMHMEDVSKHDSIEAIIKHFKTLDKPYILARGFHQSGVKEQRDITRDDLDKVSKDIPIIIYRVCGHQVMANSKAIDKATKMFGVKDDESEGYFLKDGIFKEDEIHYVLETLPKVTEEKIKEEILLAQDYLLAQGITAIGSDDFSMYKIPYETIMNAFIQLDKENKT